MSGYRYILPSGSVVLVDTPEDLLALDQVVQAAQGAVPSIDSADKPSEEAEGSTEAWAMFSLLVAQRKRQLQLLHYMKQRGEQPTSLKEMASALRVKAGATIGGTVSGIRKNTRKAKLDEDAVLCRLRDGRYVAGPSLRAARTLPAAPQVQTSRYDMISAGDVEVDVKD